MKTKKQIKQEIKTLIKKYPKVSNVQDYHQGKIEALEWVLKDD